MLFSLCNQAVAKKTVLQAVTLAFDYFLNNRGSRTKGEKNASRKITQLRTEKALSFSSNNSMILLVLSLLKN